MKETIYPRADRYLIASGILGVAAALISIAYYGFPRLAASFRVTLRVVPPPLPGLPAGHEALNTMGLVYLSVLAPLAVYARRLARLIQVVDLQTIALVRDLLGLLRSGYSVVDAVMLLHRRDYGPLNVFIRRLASFLASNHTFEESFNAAVKGLPRFTQAMLHTILDAYQAGGRALELATSISSVFSSIESLEELRRSAIGGYIYILGISVIMYSAVAGATLYLSSSLWGTASGGGPLTPVLAPYEVRAILYYGAFIISLAGGLIAAKLSSNTVRVTPWYAFLYFLAATASLEATSLLLA